MASAFALVLPSFMNQPAVFILSTIAVLLVVSFGLGTLIAGQLRLRDFGFKIGAILLAFFASVVVIYFGWPPKLGIDLGGGAILVFKVDTDKSKVNEEMMNNLVIAISKRINPGGQKEIIVRKFGNDMIEIELPAIAGSNEDDKRAEKEAIKNIINQQGKMEFHILATHNRNESLIEQAMKLPEGAKVYNSDHKELAQWCKIHQSKEKGEEHREEDQLRNNRRIVTRPTGDGRYETLVLTGENDPYNVTGDYLQNPRKSRAENMTPCVSFSFNDQGAALFSRLTTANSPLDDGFKFQLAIILDGEVQTAPDLNGPIGAQGQITGNFNDKEVDELVQILDAGSLPAALEKEPVRDMVTGPLLGDSTIKKSRLAMIISSILVPLFMFWYYRFPGLVANIALFLNMVMLVAVMILIKAPFTLPALAGLALTVGMAVDNNVLIYERLREELEHGAALRMAIRNSFHRAGVVIIDANITHLIAASVLWRVGTEQIKGFAVTFFLGAVLSIWATMFVAHVLFDIAERKRWITKIHMMHIIGHTKIDFMGWFPACATFSVLITVLGVVVAIARGPGLFDIDFIGGVSVQTVFNQDEDIDKLRATVEANKSVLPDGVVLSGDVTGEPPGRRFMIETSNHNSNDVLEKIKDLFGKELVRCQLEYGPEKSPGEINAEKPAADASGPALGTSSSKPAPSTSAPTAPPKPTANVLPEVKPAPAKASDTASAAPKSSVAVPAAPKSTDVKPADSKGTDAKPAGANPAVPKATGVMRSRRFLPSLSLVAMAGPEAVLLAQTEKPDRPADTSTPPVPKSSTQSAASKPTESITSGDNKPMPAAGTSTGPSKASESKPSDPKSSEAKSSQTKPAETKPEEKKPITGTKPVEPAETSEPEKELPPGPTFQAEVSFETNIPKIADGKTTDKAEPMRFTKSDVEKLGQAALKAAAIAPASVRLAVNPVASAGNNETLSLADHWTVRVQSLPGQTPLTKEKFDNFLEKMAESTSELPYFSGVDTIGEAVAKNTEFWAVIALASSWSLIILYLWIRFQGVAFGVAAVIALIHDVLVMLGAIAFSSFLSGIPLVSTFTLIEPFKINLQIVAAFMTIIGYSVNDTIVVFDRIREIRGKAPSVTRQMVNDATNQTLSRTLLTSFTVLLVVFILYVAGGEAVHGFAFALFIGVLTGTYSSIYVAAPVLLWLLHPKEMVATDVK